MLIDRLQSLIAVLITLIGVLLANSASERYPPTDWSNEAHNQSNNKSLNKNSQDWLSSAENMTLEKEVADHRWLSSRKTQEYLVSIGGREDCCPSNMEMIEPIGGSNPDGLFVELYRYGEEKQRFYEVSCKPGVEGKPCLFMDRKLHGHSACEQRYSYSYAIVRELQVRHHHHLQKSRGDASHQFQSLLQNDVWKLDYIKVRSGCACAVHSSKKKQQKQQQQRRNTGDVAGGDGGGGG